MNTSKLVTVVHPDSKVRVALRSTLEAHGCTVTTDHSCGELLADSRIRPNLILMDRSLLGEEGSSNILSQLNRKWEETEIVFLPEGLAREMDKTAILQILPIVDRLLKMRTTRELLAT